MSERPNDPFETAVAELRERWVDVPEPNRLKIVNRRLDELAESAFDGEKPKFVKKGEEVGVWQEALGREKEELEKKLGTNSERSFHQGRKRPGSLNTLAEEIKRDADEQGFSTESERNAYIERMLAENDESLAENMPDNQGYGSRNMVAKEKQEVLKEIQFDPEGFLREAVIHLFKNPGDYEYVIALRHVANTDYFTDRQKTFLKNIQPITQAAERMKPIGKLEEGLRNIGHPEPEFLKGWLEFSVPIRITAGGRTFTHDLAVYDTFDAMNKRLGIFRRNLLHGKSGVRKKGKKNHAKYLIRSENYFGVPRNLYDDDVPISVEYADFDERSEQLTIERHKKYGIETHLIDQYSSEPAILEALLKQKGKLKNSDGEPITTFSALENWLDWNLNASENLMDVFGWNANLDKIMTNGRFIYAARKGWRGDRYLEGFGIGMLWLRCHGDTGYRDLFSENKSKLFPWEGIPNLDSTTETYRELGLENRNVLEEMWGPEGKKSKAFELASFALYDAPLQDWLKPYEQLIYSGGMNDGNGGKKPVVFDAYTPVNVPRNHRKLGFDIYGTQKEYKGQVIHVDFTNLETARQFIIQNRTSKAWVRPDAEALIVAESFTEEEKAVFNGRNYEVVLKHMKAPAGTETRGFEGFLNTLRYRSFKDLLVENLNENDIQKYWGYMGQADATHGIFLGIIGSMNFGSKSEVHAGSSDYKDAVAQEGELLKAIQSFPSSMPWSDDVEKEEKIMSFLTGMVNNVSHRKTKHWRYKAVRGQNGLALTPFKGEVDTNTNKTMAEIASTQSSVRNAFNKSRAAALGFTIEGYGNEAVICGPGGHVVYEGVMVKPSSDGRGGSFPAGEHYGSREIDIKTFEKAIRTFLDKGMLVDYDNTGSKTSRVRDYFEKVQRHGLLRNAPDIASSEFS